MLGPNQTLTDEMILFGSRKGHPVYEALEIVCKGPEVPLPEEWKAHPYSGPPVLFGHYWFTGKPEVISPRFACLD